MTRIRLAELVALNWPGIGIDAKTELIDNLPLDLFDENDVVFSREFPADHRLYLLCRHLIAAG